MNCTVLFKGTTLHLLGTQPSIGAKAKDFHLTGKDLQDKSLKDFTESRKLLYTVPSLDTPVCSRSFLEFSKKLQGIDDLCFLLISADLPFAQQRVCLMQHVEKVETLSVMRNHQFALDYGILIDSLPLKGLLARAVFLLSDDNKLIYSEIVHEITQEPNYDAAISAIQASQKR